ncbi:MAG TPA: tetratricopeptide repeat protein [Thermoanaerobaculia bacterium]|nr:tetratricopeptide repeat protein [Thermoanaerobaculia bacterium]
MSPDYPGNPALPPEVRQRVLATFRQTLELYDQALLDDVVVGCDFLLKMDPLFTPAKKLLEKARNPAAPVDLKGLMAIAKGGERAAAAPAAGAVPTPAAGGADLTEARAALESGEYQLAVDLTETILRTDMMNEEAQRISEQARDRIEADPFIQQFAATARQQMANGDLASARTSFEKAKALDPRHPALVELERDLDNPPPAAPAFDPLSAFGVSSAGSEGSGRGGFDFDSFTPEPSESEPAPPRIEPASGDVFVVDSGSPQPPEGASRAGAPASEFGFTFEEDTAAPPTAAGQPQRAEQGSAGSTPREAAEAVSGDPFDFSTASVDVSQEDQAKIDGYLRQGDQAYGKMEVQKAIDLWSRIFLIDVTNEPASDRIEKARAKKMEMDRQVDELATEAVGAMQQNDAATARRLYEKILAIDPTNESAVERLAELAASPASPSSPATPRPARPTPPAAHPFDEPLFGEQSAASFREEVLVPPPGARETALDDEAFDSPAARSRPAAERPAAARSRTPLFAAIGLVVLLGIGFGAWKLFFSGGPEPVQPVDNTLSRAQTLAGQGELDQAIGVLLAIPPTHPDHDDAMTLVAELRARKAQAAGRIEGRPSPEVFSERVEQGRAAFAARDYVGAKAAFEEAATLQTLPPDVRAMYDQSMRQVSRLATAENLLKSGNYHEAIAAAQAILRDDPENANAIDLVARGHFNLGVAALQAERLQDATVQFDRVLEIRPDDEIARRARELSIRYEGRPKDLLYRIFVKYLQAR